MPFAIPEKWKWVSLGAVSRRIHYGYTASAKEKGNAKLLRITDIQNGVVNWISVPYCSLEEKEIEKFRLTPGDLVIARTGGTIGKSFLITEKLEEITVFASYLIRVIPDKLNINPSYLLSFLDSPCYWEQLSDNSRGTGQPNVNARALSEIKFPLPPIDEQQRIVAKLNELLSLVEIYGKEQEALEKLEKEFPDKLRASLLQEAIRGKLVPQLESEPEVRQLGEVPENVPFAIPEKWKWVKLENLGKWKSGGTPSRSHREYYENGTIPWLKTGDLNDGVIKSVGEYITNSGLENSSAHINPAGSVLIAMYGATIGKVGILQFPCATNQACCACVLKENICDQWYLFYFLLSQRKNFIALGAGGAQPNISRTKIVNSWIPLPPLEEQHRIVAKLNELIGSISQLAQTISTP